MIQRRAVFTLLVSLSCLPNAAAAGLASYRAVYDMDLARASERSGLSDVAGRMVYEFRGSPCAGYAVKFRSVAAFQTEDSEQLIDQRATTFEDMNENRFSFTTQSFIDNQFDKEVKGEATKKEADGAVSVSLSLPEAKTLALPNALFPTAHMMDLLKRAEAGQKIYKTNVFDGTENGDKVLLTNVVIGERQGAGQGGDSEFGPLLNGAHWPISMSYYDTSSDDGGEDEPVFRLSFDLYDNGVAKDFSMDYGEFVVTQTLVELEPVDAPACEAPTGD